MLKAKRFLAGTAIAMVIGAWSFAVTGVEITSAGTFTGYFTEISGLGSEHEVVEYQEGGENSRTRNLTKSIAPNPMSLEDELDPDEEDFDIN